MGKHDKEIQMKWDDDAAESYTEVENQRLRSENARLKAKIKALEKEADRMEKVYARVAEAADAAIKQKNAEGEKRLRAMGLMAEKIYV